MACHHVARSYVAPRQFASLVLAVFEEKDLLTTSGGFAYFPCGSNSRSFLLVLTHLSFAHIIARSSLRLFIFLLGCWEMSSNLVRQCLIVSLSCEDVNKQIHFARAVRTEGERLRVITRASNRFTTSVSATGRSL